MKLQIISHALLEDKITKLRDKSTEMSSFRSLLQEIGALLFFEATKNIPTTDTTVHTPLEKAPGKNLSVNILLVPVLRAGLGFLNGITPAVGNFPVGMIGVARDEKTLEPTIYLSKLPESLLNTDVFLLDPMLATGGSSIAAVKLIKDRKPSSITLLSAIAAPEGVRAMNEACPDVAILVAALDRQLNERGFILPGLGDAGDRYFGS